MMITDLTNIYFFAAISQKAHRNIQSWLENNRIIAAIDKYVEQPVSITDGPFVLAISYRRLY